MRKRSARSSASSRSALVAAGGEQVREQRLQDAEALRRDRADGPGRSTGVPSRGAPARARRGARVSLPELAQSLGDGLGSSGGSSGTARPFWRGSSRPAARAGEVGLEDPSSSRPASRASGAPTRRCRPGRLCGRARQDRRSARAARRGGPRRRSRRAAGSRARGASRNGCRSGCARRGRCVRPRARGRARRRTRRPRPGAVRTGSASAPRPGRAAATSTRTSPSAASRSPTPASRAVR